MPSGSRLLLRNVLVAAAYFATGQLGLLAAFAHGAASPFWPPSGIALAAVLAWGPGMLPGVFLGSLATNTTVGASSLPAIGAACGNVIEALLATFLLRRLIGFRSTFERVTDAVGFIVLGAMLSTAVSAAIGVSALYAGGVIDRASLAGSFVSWWTGNGMGVLLVAPLFLVWRGPRLLPDIPRWRTLFLVAGLAGTTLLVFGPATPLPSELREEILIIPFLIWAALDHGPRGAFFTCAAVTAYALWRTAAGEGPFVRTDVWEQVWLVQVFSGASTLTSLILGSATVERRRAVDLRDEFISVASHELKTPLTTVLLELDALRVLTGGEPEVQRTREGMQRQLDRLGQLVNAMLDIARLTGGPLPIDKEEVDLADLARTVAERSEELFHESNTPLEVVARTPVHCACDRLRIDQAISNLLSNAAKYGAGRPVRLEVRRDGEDARVEVVDQGIGIALEDQQRIFQRFERAAPDRAIAGLGLGLYIVAQIVDAHDGRVEVESAKGQGARFTIALPLG